MRTFDSSTRTVAPRTAPPSHISRSRPRVVSSPLRAIASAATDRRSGSGDGHCVKGTGRTPARICRPQDVLDESRLEAGRFVVTGALGRLGAAIDAAVVVVQPEAVKKGVTLEERPR